jgi:hypothetical protein
MEVEGSNLDIWIDKIEIISVKYFKFRKLILMSKYFISVLFKALLLTIIMKLINITNKNL